MLAPDGNFYGTTEYGGNTVGNSSFNGGLGGGTVFRMTTNGNLTTLVNFASTNGSSPHGGLTWGPDGNLYGTTATGGPNGLPYGTVFRVTTGGALTILTNFNNSNGANPYASLTLGPDGNFYGTTQSGGPSNAGTVFKVTTNAMLTTLYAFGTTNGISPETSLTLGSDGNFYGTTMQSYVMPFTPFPGFTINLPSGNGTIFQITTNGVLTMLVDFDNYNAGGYPNASLLLDADGSFYGVTYIGGSNGLGTLFRVTTNGMLTTLVNFNNTDGAYPIGGLTFGPDDIIYGTTSSGGIGGNGNVFELSTRFHRRGWQRRRQLHGVGGELSQQHEPALGHHQSGAAIILAGARHDHHGYQRPGPVSRCEYNEHPGEVLPAVVSMT